MKGEVHMKKKYLSTQRKHAMNISFSQFGYTLSMLLLSPALLAANLQQLDVASLPGDRVELKLSFDEPVVARGGIRLNSLLVLHLTFRACLTS